MLTVEASTAHTHPIHQLSHHAVPHLCFRVSGTVLAVTYELKAVREADVFGDLRGELGTVTFIFIVSPKLLVVLL